jgi:hypothetical protein
VSLRLDVRFDRPRYVPGDQIRGTVYVREGGPSRALSVLLEYHERTRVSDEIAEQLSTGTIHTGDLATGQTLAFELTIPPHAFPNCESPHGSLSWELDVWSAERGRDTHERRLIVVDARP